MQFHLEADEEIIRDLAAAAAKANPAKANDIERDAVAWTRAGHASRGRVAVLLREMMGEWKS